MFSWPIFFQCKHSFQCNRKYRIPKVLLYDETRLHPSKQKKLGSELLDSVYDSVKDEIREEIQLGNVSAALPLTIMQDGWSNSSNDPIIAHSIHNDKKSYLLSIIDAGSAKKTAEYCTEQLKCAIEEIKTTYGQDVFAVCTDNENKMNKMKTLVKQSYPNIITYGCSAHYMNLLEKETCTSAVLKHVVEVQKYFRNTHQPHMQSDSCHLSDAVHQWIYLSEQEDFEVHHPAIMKRFKDATEPFHFLAYITHPRYMGKGLTMEQENCAEEWLHQRNPDFLPVLLKFKLQDPSVFPPHMMSDSVTVSIAPYNWWQLMKHKQGKEQCIESEFCCFIGQLHSCPASSGLYTVYVMEKGTSIVSPILSCTLTIENLTSQGTIRKSTIYKNAKLILGRNEFRDIMLQIETPKMQMKYIIREFNMHRRFLKEGKATLHLKDHLINLMIANAPPNLLLSLLKMLSEKMAKNEKENVPLRQRMLSNVPKSFEEISPLTIKECETLRQRNGQLPVQERNPSVGTSWSSPISTKRKREGCDKGPKTGEEKPPKVLKLINPIILNKEQLLVLSSVKAGNNVFFTGSAGTGKSFLLRRIMGTLPPDVTYMTASTGIAACHIGGTTLHSFAGIGSGSASVEECISLAKRKQYAAQWKNCKHLIIDEISMVDGMFFEKMEAVARSIRGNDKPFGGIQLILCGDFLQLPPVTKSGVKKVFCFQSSAWQKCVHVNIELTQVKRQNDQCFIEILQNLRLGRCTSDQEQILKNTINNAVEKDGIKATRLCTHKEDVEHINNAQLKKLPGEMKTFSSVDSDPYLGETLDNSTPVLGRLRLKVGAQVMLMKNLDVSQGLVNGARGVITSFKGQDGFPVVKFACGMTREIKHEKWSLKARGGLILTRRQIPLKLAWAFSIHKSQGMTLDCVEMSLSKVFEAGQAYVALSRSRNLESLRILDFNTQCIRAHPEVLKFYHNLNCSSGVTKQKRISDLF